MEGMPPEVFHKLEEASLSKEVLEREIMQSLSTFPVPLRIQWTEKFDEAEDLVLFKNELALFIKKRGEALSSSVEVFPSKNEAIRKEVQLVTSVISQTFGDANYFLGNGYTAEVYELPVAPHLCVKYIYNQSGYNECNHIRVEYNFLCLLNGVSDGVVRTPIPAFLRIHPSEGHVYGMERVMGRSLSQILEKPEENKELIKVAQGLEREKAHAEIRAFLEKMHQMKVTHNDLFMRNIMLDNEGNFFIIDFGKAKHEDLGEDRVEERRRDLFLANNELSLFFKKQYFPLPKRH